MAAVAIKSPLRLEHLFKDISPMFDRKESKNVLQYLKKNYEGKFNSLGSHDLLQCLQLLAKHGCVWKQSETNRRLRNRLTSLFIHRLKLTGTFHLLSGFRSAFVLLSFRQS